jgi:uncharacterized protein YndB with AHSA1/START domain
MKKESHALRVEQLCNAPASAVFDAWTKPDLLKQWMHPGPDAKTLGAEVDLRVGGAYRIEFDSPDGRTYYEIGTYRELSPPTRIAYSCIFGSPGFIAPFETMVTVELHDEGGRPLVVVIGEGYPDVEFRDAHRQGWPVFLELLAGIFAKSQGKP